VYGSRTSIMDQKVAKPDLVDTYNLFLPLPHKRLKKLASSMHRKKKTRRFILLYSVSRSEPELDPKLIFLNLKNHQ
jgi:hypothetical protein